MEAVNQEFPEVSPDQPEMLLRDRSTMRLAYDIAHANEWPEHVNYGTRAEAYLNGLKVVEELDKLADKEGLMRRAVVISGPSVKLPDTTVETLNGATHIVVDSTKNDTHEDGIIGSYREHSGNFFGFGIIVDTQDIHGERRYVPQIAYVMQIGKKINTPVVSGQLSAYGLVKDTDIYFVEDALTLNRHTHAGELADKSLNMDYYILAHVDIFKNCMDSPLDTKNLSDIIGALEAVTNYYYDDKAFGLLDTMTDMLKQYIFLAPDYNFIRPVLSYSYGYGYGNSLNPSNGPTLTRINDERLDDDKKVYPIKAQEIVFMPRYDNVDSSGKWVPSDEKIVYFVYNENGEDIYVPARSSEVIIDTGD